MKQSSTSQGKVRGSLAVVRLRPAVPFLGALAVGAAAMGDVRKVAIAVDDETNTATNGGNLPKKTLKRKRPFSAATLTPDQKASQIQDLRKEIEGLLAYYNQVMNQKPGGFGLAMDLTPNASSSYTSLNGKVGLLMEESELPLSKLVEQIYAKLSLMDKDKDTAALTPAVVKAAVLLVGQRMMYGVPNLDADVLEDHSPASLWCWETRDVKMMPKSIHGTLKIRRTCRKKIHERITAVSAMMTALEKSETDQNGESELKKASEKLGKVLKEADIRLLVDGMLQKNGAEMSDREAKRKEKMLLMQLEKSKRESEREKKRAELEAQKENRQNEKEQRRLQEEAEKDERRREKAESEMRRQLRKQHEDAEREQRRREKEDAELKKRLSIQKQASMMERFIKRSKTSSPCQIDQSSSKKSTPSYSSEEVGKMPEAVTLLMDCALSSNDEFIMDNIRQSHLSSWHHLGHFVRLNTGQHWSIRRKPKTELFKELKLTAFKELAHEDNLSAEKLLTGWGELTSDDSSSFTQLDCSSHDIRRCNHRTKLLQFDKSHRPAFYGIWPKQSHAVGPRHPFRKDPDLDYDIDSDEEWEEEDPGESLSDCDKDDGEESLEERCTKADEEEESEDGFFVPDGYFSENEGVQIDRMETDLSVDVAESSSGCKQDMESEEFHALLQQQKYLSNLTESALRRNQPLIILNMMHEKVPLIAAEDPTGTSKVEKLCLQALSIRAVPGAPHMEITVDNMQDDAQDVSLSTSKINSTPPSTEIAVQDSDVPMIVSTIQSCSQSITKVVESLQQKFPTISKFHLKNKVREISDFVDNRWQVKKKVLEEVGMSISPEKRGRRMQNISAYFSKRCLPPPAGAAGKSIDDPNNN